MLSLLYILLLANLLYNIIPNPPDNEKTDFTGSHKNSSTQPNLTKTVSILF